MPPRISSIAQDSIAAELGLRPGDELLAINGRPVEDLIAYRYLTADEHVELRVRTAAGERILDIEKHPDEDLGLGFDDPTFTGVVECTQHCVFCFVDQLPPGMRSTMQIKDDDYRLSFLQGNFVTLTNLTDDDLDRVLRLRLSPLYVSVHSTEKRVRTRLFRSRTHMRGLENLRFLARRGIELHAQIVLCPGINNGRHLERTLADLAELFPGVRSVAIVPVGLTSYRGNLYPLQPVGPQEARELVARTREWQRGFLERLGTRFVFLADEIYLAAGVELPAIEEYEDLSQVENGVGLCVPFFETLGRELDAKHPLPDADDSLIVTGEAAAPLFDRAFRAAYDRALAPHIVTVRNRLFGGYVTVAALMGGADVARELARVGRGSRRAIVPAVALNDEGRFLDDLSVEDVAARTGLKIEVAGRPRALAELLAGQR